LKPSYGKVVIEGIKLSSSGKSWTEVRQRVALMSQYLEQQLFEETVFGDISFVLRQGKVLYTTEIENQVQLRVFNYLIFLFRNN